jgi:hypothetical protein
VRRVFAALEVDFDQWKALTAVALKLDLRLTGFGGAALHRKRRAVFALLLFFMVYTLFGAFMALVVLFTRDLLLAGTITMTSMMFIIGTAVLLDHNSAVTSPADYAILGFRPIGSRTYFAVRLTNVLVYTTALTTAAGWLPAGAIFVRHGAVIGAAGLVAFYACSTSTALAMVTVYASILRLVGAEALKRALSYVQLAMSLLVYGGYLVISQFLLSKTAVAGMTMPRTPWIRLFPATWFASYLLVAAGRAGPAEVASMVASIVAFGAMASGLAGRLSLDYSARLGALTTDAAMKPARRSSREPVLRRTWFGTGEARAIALLVRTQYRNDLRFRMGILGILPVTLLYVGMAAYQGSMMDPFVPHRHFSPITMAVVMFPQILKMQLTRSTAFRASWVFFACPADRMSVLRAGKNVLVAFFLVPYLLFVVAVYAYFAHNLWHVIVHVMLLGALSHLALQIFVLVDPQLPFSRPMEAGGQSAVFTGTMFGMSIIAGILEGLSALLYASAVATTLAFGALALCSAAVDRLTRVRVERQMASLEFEG